jgi:hypothetical protein
VLPAAFAGTAFARTKEENGEESDRAINPGRSNLVVVDAAGLGGGGGGGSGAAGARGRGSTSGGGGRRPTAGTSLSSKKPANSGLGSGASEDGGHDGADDDDNDGVPQGSGTVGDGVRVDAEGYIIRDETVVPPPTTVNDGFTSSDEEDGARPGNLKITIRPKEDGAPASQAGVPVLSLALPQGVSLTRARGKTISSAVAPAALRGELGNNNSNNRNNSNNTNPILREKSLGALTTTTSSAIATPGGPAGDGSGGGGGGAGSLAVPARHVRASSFSGMESMSSLNMSSVSFADGGGDADDDESRGGEDDSQGGVTAAAAASASDDDNADQSKDADKSLVAQLDWSTGASNPFETTSSSPQPRVDDTSLFDMPAAATSSGDDPFGMSAVFDASATFGGSGSGGGGGGAHTANDNNDDDDDPFGSAFSAPPAAASTNSGDDPWATTKATTTPAFDLFVSPPPPQEQPRDDAQATPPSAAARSPSPSAQTDKLHPAAPPSPLPPTPPQRKAAQQQQREQHEQHEQHEQQTGAHDAGSKTPALPTETPAALMKASLAHLESGRFPAALAQAVDAMRLLDPSAGARVRWVAGYVVAVRLLVRIKEIEGHASGGKGGGDASDKGKAAGDHGGGSSDDADDDDDDSSDSSSSAEAGARVDVAALGRDPAALAQMLVSIPLSQRHRLVCVRMALKRNWTAKNYGVCHEMIQVAWWWCLYVVVFYFCNQVFD